MGARCDLKAGSTTAAGVKCHGRSSLAEQGGGQLLGKRAFANPRRPNKQKGHRSGDQFLHHFSRHIGQAEITSVEAVGQPLVIKAHQLEDRRM